MLAKIRFVTSWHNDPASTRYEECYFNIDSIQSISAQTNSYRTQPTLKVFAYRNEYAVDHPYAEVDSWIQSLHLSSVRNVRVVARGGTV